MKVMWKLTTPSLWVLVWASNPPFYISNLSVPWKWTKLGILSWNWVSVQKTCNEIRYRFMQLGISLDDLQWNCILGHEIGYQFGRFAMKLHIGSWNWVSVWKICNEIAYCFMKLSISLEDLQWNSILFHETGYQFGRFAMKIGHCFMKLGINSENLQQNWVLFHETGY
jgi:hypothetical protein